MDNTDITQVATKKDIQELGAEVKAQGEQLKSHGEQLKSHGEQLKSHGEQLKSHGEQLKAQTSEIRKLSSEVKSQRTDSKRTERSLRSEILRVEGKVENIEEGQKEQFKDIKIILDKLQNTLDGFVGTVDTLRTENIVGSHQTQELRTKVTNHEKRIIQLESYPHAA